MTKQVLVLGTAWLVVIATARPSMNTGNPHTNTAVQAHRVQRYGALPLAFELNAGQANPSAKW